MKIIYDGCEDRLRPVRLTVQAESASAADPALQAALASRNLRFDSRRSTHYVVGIGLIPGVT